MPKHTGGTTKVVGSPAGVSFDELLFPLLTDRKLAASSLSEALLDSDPRVFLSALKNVATAQGVGLAGSKSKLSPEKPDLRTLESLLDDMGFRLSVEAKDAA